LKATRKSATSTISLKETLNQKDGKITSADELKFWFPFQGTKTLYARIKNDGFKLHYDHGVLSQNDLKFNFYGSVQGKRTISQLISKIGVEVQNKDLTTDWRLKYVHADNGLNLYNKSTYSQEKWKLGVVNSFDIFNRSWNHSALQLGWQCESKAHQYYIRTNAGKKYEQVNPKNFLQSVTFDVIHKINDSNRLALEVLFSL
jgi:hypothetical protein